MAIHLSKNIKNLKFMNNVEKNIVNPEDKTFSYYALKNFKEMMTKRNVNKK
ncbi:hypothetical protein NUSPORA_00307 [Nucleospora cyclopteri]